MDELRRTSRRDQRLAATRRRSICIIGAGISGLSTAYMLARDGKSVVVIDDGPIARRQRRAAPPRIFPTPSTTGMSRLNGCTGNGAPALRRKATHARSNDRANRFGREDRLRFPAGQRISFLPPGRETGVSGAGTRGGAACGRSRGQNGGPGTGARLRPGPCLCFPRQGQFHAVRYMAGLADAAERRGVKIYTAAMFPISKMAIAP